MNKIYFYDMVGIKTSDFEEYFAEEVDNILKTYGLDRTKMVKPISNYRARHKVPAGQNIEVTYEEAVMETRKLFQPYNAILVCYSDTDQTALAEMMTDKSVVITIDRYKTKIGRYQKYTGSRWYDRWIRQYHTYSPSAYIDHLIDEDCEDSTYGRLVKAVDGDDNRTIDEIYQYNRKCDIFGTSRLHIRKNQDSVMNQWYLEATCGNYKHEFHTGKNHFDFDQEDEVIETYEMARSAKNKIQYTSVSFEKASQDMQYQRAVEKWLNELAKTNEEKYKAVYDLYYNNPDLYSCEVCETKFDIYKCTCPICGSENPASPIDPRNSLPWIQNKLHGLDSTTEE